MKIVIDISKEKLAKYQHLFTDGIFCPDVETGTEAMCYILEGEYLIEKDEKGD